MDKPDWKATISCTAKDRHRHERRQPLIVVERHRHVEFAPRLPVEKRVARLGARKPGKLAPQLVEERIDDLTLLAPDQPRLAGMDHLSQNA